MNEWFSALTLFQQILFVTGAISTLIFLIQFVLTVSGIGGDDYDLGADGSSSHFDFGDLFSIRNAVTFLMGFSWGGLMAHDWGLTHPSLMSLVGFFVGGTFVAVTLFLMLAMSRLRHAGNINLENAIDQQGRVTLSIPGHRSGVGKVSLSIQGRLKEYHAVTDGEKLDRNSPVTVLELAGSQLVVCAFVPPTL